MERTHVESSTLRSVGYDRDSLVLEIEFVNGNVYRYSSVPERVHDTLMRAPSKGTYFSQHIRDVYRYEQLP